MNLKEAGINVGLAIAGLFGSVLMMSKDSAQNLIKTLFSLLGGAASANYITPLLLKVARVGDDPQYSYSMAFLLGFAGLRAIEVVSMKFFPDDVPTKHSTHPVPNSGKRRR